MSFIGLQLPSGARKGNPADADQGLAVGSWDYGKGSTRFLSLNPVSGS